LKRRINLEINGKAFQIPLDPSKTLLEVLREDLGLTGTKNGCSEGECGACTVLLDGRAVYACLLLVSDAEGKRITTIEGLAEGDRLDPVQEAFVEHGAIQCGFCTPGMILSAKALLDENPVVSEEEVKTALAGNLCRCTGYRKIISAVVAAGTKLAEEKR
jgi:carbon-monoxide dehydrogenase small subunit